MPFTRRGDFFVYHEGFGLGSLDLPFVPSRDGSVVLYTSPEK